MLEHNNFREALTNEINELQKLKEQLEASVREAPEGTLNILTKAGKEPQYYWYRGRNHRTYIRKEDEARAKLLAQKEYNKMILQIIDARLEKALCLLKEYDVLIEEMKNELCHQKQTLIQPAILSDEEYIKEWYAKHQGGKNAFPIHTAYYSNGGVRVRSKSEKIIADLFEKHQIPYVYEPELVLENGKTIYPDFLVLNVRLRKTMVYEHFGMMSDSAYSEKTCEKMMNYGKKNYFPGETLIFSMESQNEPLNTRIIEKTILKYLK